MRADKGLALAALIAVASTVGCWKYSADYCAGPSDCVGKGFCDLRTQRCVLSDGGADAGPDGRAGSSAAGGAGGFGPVDGGTHDAADGGGVDSGRCSQTTECMAQLLTPVCDVKKSTCVQCVESADCHIVGRPACKPDSNTCVECVASTDCAGVAGKPACDTAANACVACVANTDCKTPSAPVCDMPAKMCVGCLVNGDCSGSTPICEMKSCRACKTDAECPADPGICLPDGRCATSDQVLYVESNASGCPGADGSAAKPFCAPNDAVAKLTATQHVIVIRGPADGRMTLATTGKAPVIIGRKNGAGESASVPANVGAALAVSSDSVFVRDLIVNAGTTSSSKGIAASGATTKLTLSRVAINLGMGLGLEATTGSKVTLDQCRIQGNSAGGILINGAGYDIQNTLVAENGFGVAFSALPIPAGARFSFNTVAGNAGFAATCDVNNPQALSYSIISGANSFCTTDTSVTAAPAFDGAKPYHLTSKLACPGGDPATYPDHDIDGDPRSKPIDCGADQL